MVAILVEGVLFVAFVVTVAALLLFVLAQFTPVGLWLRQSRNRRQIERAAELRCPIHGPHDPTEMVRLPSGERICPACFKEIVDGNLDD
jgi:hypothetical protein